MSINALQALVKLETYRERNQHLFPSKGSFEWFVRRHRSDLIESGSMLMIAGHWHVHPTKFDTFVLQQGERAARGRLRQAA